MRQIQADYFDGRTAQRHAVMLTVVNGMVVIARAGAEAVEHRLADVRVQPRLSGAPRRIELPNGAVAITNDHAGVEAAFAVTEGHTLAHRLESHVGFVLTAMFGVVLAMVWGYLYGVPWLARVVSNQLPVTIEAQIATAGLKSLDQIVFEPSGLDAAKRAEITAAFEHLRGETPLPRDVRLEFRTGGWVHANALALPGGVIVVTDELVEAMPGLNEVAAVLAHELGHVQHRHSLRHLLQDSITALAAMAIYGDASAITGLAATAPTALIHSGYSRDFEREADAYAFELLKKTGRSPLAFATAMTALEAAHDKRKEEGKAGQKNGGGKSAEPTEPNSRRGSEASDYLSTHPATSERIEAAKEAARH